MRIIILSAAYVVLAGAFVLWVITWPLGWLNQSARRTVEYLVGLGMLL